MPAWLEERAVFGTEQAVAGGRGMGGGGKSCTCMCIHTQGDPPLNGFFCMLLVGPVCQYPWQHLGKYAFRHHIWASPPSSVEEKQPGRSEHPG